MSLLLDAISLYQFKNYFHQEFRFTERIVGICGRNGMGKTNLLDAIYYLCFTKSYFTRQDSGNVQHGHQGFRLEGQLRLRGEPEKAVCVLRETGRKEFSINDVAYSRFSAHIGRYPCVIIAPDDVQLIIGGSEDRRKFVDTLLSQLDPDYLQALIQYTRILQQRNSFLRSYEHSYGGRDLTVLDILDEQLVREGNYLYTKRRDFLLGFLPSVKQLYQNIAKQYEDIGLFYESELHQTGLEDLLQSNRQKDLALQRTSGGLHRDDLQFQMGKGPFKNIASQGQRKSLLFALKLAEMDVLRAQKRLAPLLLLDDVFEKLDEERIGNLLLQVCTENEGQVFITDTNFARLKAQLESMGLPYQLIAL